MKLQKAYEIASFKALTDTPGSFEAIVSVFGNVDLQGDRTMPGAFTNTIARWREKGAPVPVIWSHEWLNPDAHVGYVMPENMAEVSAAPGPNGETGGLYVKGRMDINKPFASQVFDLLKEGRIREWSFAYDTIEEQQGADGANELLEVDLIEVGPTLKGANSATFTISAKSMKAAENELKEAYEAQRSLKHFIELIKDIEDPDIARMMTKTYTQGPAPDTVRERFHVEVAASGEYVCMSNKTWKAVDTHEESEAAEAHTYELNEMDVDPSKLSDEMIRAALDLPPLQKAEGTLITAKVGEHEFLVDPAALVVDEEFEEKAAEVANGEKSHDPMPNSAEEIRQHLEAAHGASDITETSMKEMEAAHIEAHAGSTDHTHPGHPTTATASVDGGEEKAVASNGTVTVDVVPQFTYTNSTTGTAQGVPVTNGTITLGDVMKAELEGAGLKAGRVIGRNSATALKEALVRAVDDFVKSVNDRADAGADDGELEGKSELEAYNAKFDELLGEEK